MQSRQEDPADFIGLTQNDLINYINNKTLADINSTEELNNRSKLLGYVIKRLVSTDKMLIWVQEEGPGQPGLLNFHPNYVCTVDR